MTTPLWWLLSKLFGVVTTLRNFSFNAGIVSAYHSSLPVVSVGNLSVGGTGKSPLVLRLVQGFQARGFSPVILSRGYGGSLKGPVKVDHSHQPTEIGDEPLLLFSRSKVPVVVAKSRVDGARLIENENLGDLIILDDGFQHRWLARTVDILSIDVGAEEARQQFLSGRMLPDGIFREDRDRGLHRADLIVLSHRKPRTIADELEPDFLKTLPSGGRIFQSFVEPRSLSPLLALPETDAHSALAAGAEVVAFCGIANPSPFFATIEESGLSITDQQVFADHHPFTMQDLVQLAALAGDRPLVCTEKDAVKLLTLSTKPVEILRRIFVLSITTRIDPEDAFLVTVERLIKDRRHPHSSIS